MHRIDLVTYFWYMYASYSVNPMHELSWYRATCMIYMEAKLFF